MVAMFDTGTPPLVQLQVYDCPAPHPANVGGDMTHVPWNNVLVQPVAAVMPLSHVLSAK